MNGLEAITGPVGAPALEGFHQGETFTVAVEEGGLRPIPNAVPYEADVSEVNLPGTLPNTAQGEQLQGVATPLIDLYGVVYAVEVRRLVSTGGYNNITVGMHAMVNPTAGFEETVKAVDHAVREQLKELGGEDLTSLEDKRAQLRNDVFRLEHQKEDLRDTLLQGKIKYDQAEATLKAVGVTMPPHRWPTWMEGQPVETDQAYLLRNGWSYHADRPNAPYNHPNNFGFYTEFDAMEEQRDLEMIASAPAPDTEANPQECEVASTA